MGPGSNENLLAGISPSLIGRDVEFFSEVTSTNVLAKEMAQKGCREGLVIIASNQTEGRGRMDRDFSSPEGGLYLSVVLRPHLPPSNVSILPLLIGLAVSKAISTTVFTETSLKWPNDVLIQNKKVCGILVESGVKGEKLEYVIVGIGINANSTMDQLPAELRETVTTLKEIKGKNIDIGDLIRHLICFLDMIYSQFLDGEIDILLDKWSERSSTIGNQVRVYTGGISIEGKALGVDRSGALMVSVDGSFQRVDIGDVEHLE